MYVTLIAVNDNWDENFVIGNSQRFSTNTFYFIIQSTIRGHDLSKVFDFSSIYDRVYTTRVSFFEETNSLRRRNRIAKFVDFAESTRLLYLLLVQSVYDNATNAI